MLYYAVQKAFCTEWAGKGMEWKSIAVEGGGVFRCICIQGFARGSDILSACLQIVSAPRVYNLYDK